MINKHNSKNRPLTFRLHVGEHNLRMIIVKANFPYNYFESIIITFKLFVFYKTKPKKYHLLKIITNPSFSHDESQRADCLTGFTIRNCISFILNKQYKVKNQKPKKKIVISHHYALLTSILYFLFIDYMTFLTQFSI